MNILDEQVIESQRQLLRSWRIPIRQIGQNIGRKGMKDQEIIPFLLQLHHSTFFTLDNDFFDRELCHRNYAIVFMDVKKSEAATFIRRIIRHPEFNTVTKRLGKVFCLSHTNIAFWALNVQEKRYLGWIEKLN